MSTPKTLVLTRPAASSARLLTQVEAASSGSVKAVTSPILRIVPASTRPDVTKYDGVVVTSAHSIQGDMGGKLAYCVGARTAEAARAAGGNVKQIALDAEQLVGWFALQGNSGNLVYLRGSHVATDIRASLSNIGISCDEVETYHQEELSLSEEACKLIEGEAPAILPLYSPRSARLVGKAIAQVGLGLHVIVISESVATAWRETTGGASVISEAPTGQAMVSKIVTALTD